MARILSRVAIGLVATGAIVASQLNVGDEGTWDIGGAHLAASRLEVARDCAEVTARVREIAAAANQGYQGGAFVDGGRVDAVAGLPADVGEFAGGDGGVIGAPPAAEVPAPATPGGTKEADQASIGGAGTRNVVGTNIQELGVDETDQLKTDGDTIFVLRDNQLIAVDVDSLDELDRIGFGQRYPYEMLLSGDRLVLFENSYAEGVAEPTADSRMGMPYYGGQPELRLTIVDVTSPSAMAIDSVVVVDGSLVAARLVDGFVRVVVTTSPNMWFGGGIGYMKGIPEGGVAVDLAVPPSGATEVVELTADDVLPTITVERNGETTSAPVPCDGVHIAPDAQTVESTTVFSLDPMNPEPVGSATAMTGGGIVYANMRSIYIARPLWDDRGERTEIHRFDITDPAQTRYVSAGTVPGSPLNQFSMSEHEGLLRVATTSGGDEANGYRSESFVQIMRESGDRLAITGTVGGLGLDERIFAVRFLGTIGYVVTFRQVDPLYVLDLSDPASPRKVGELKIPGYSAYLHPIGDGLVIGVGQDATGEGVTTGVLVSLFDVSDPADPKRIAKLDDLGQWTPVEGDHRAFQHLPDRDLIVVPTSTWNEIAPVPAPGGSGGASVDEARPEVYYEPQLLSEAHVISVSADGLEEVGRISHGALVPDPQDNDTYRTGEITRSIAIDDTLYTMSDAGLMATDLDTLDLLASLVW
jgi:hypothetical protein